MNDLTQLATLIDEATAILKQSNDTHDFRDNGTLEKVDCDPNHWSRTDRQDDSYIPGGRR